MTSIFATASTWLQSISSSGQQQGSTASATTTRQPAAAVDKRALESLLRDFHSMQDAETKAGGGGGYSMKGRNNRGGGGRGSRKSASRRDGGARMQQQMPLPKSIVHKEPTRGKKKKEKVKSNRAGKSYMA